MPRVRALRRPLPLPQDAPAPDSAPIAAIRRFLPYLWPENDPALRKRAVIALVLLVAQKCVAVVIPLLFGAAVDLVSEGEFTILALFAVLGWYAIARLLQQVFDELKHFVFARVAQRAIRNLALKTFRHMHALSLAFHLDRQTGGLSRVIERGAKSVEMLLTMAVFHILPTLLEMLLVCGILWALFDWRYAAAALVTVGGYAAYTVAVTEWRIKFRRRMNESDQRAMSHAVDSLLNFETVKYFNAEGEESRRYDSAMREYEDAAVKNRTSLSLLNIGQGVIIAAGLIVMMMMAGADVLYNGRTPGDFVVVNSYLIHLYLPLNFLGSVYREIRQALTDMEKMFEMLDAPADENPPNARPLKVRSGETEFRGVRFGYGRGEVLSGASFHVPGGKKIAVVGPSGAGKSTVARLLFRFYNPQGGAIFIDGQNLAECDAASVRAAIGVVPQEPVLFNDTIRRNIAYAKPDATDGEIERAAKAAAIHNFVSALPEGYETTVGERGLKLSGGEKQRVAIARVILKNPPLFVFDEATSALDTRTEREIQRALNDISRGRTTIVVAHRLSTVVDADEIAVLSGGTVAERGTHRQLLAQNGIYAAMWERQKRGEDGDAVSESESGLVSDSDSESESVSGLESESASDSVSVSVSDSVSESESGSVSDLESGLDRKGG